jgi:hypothetical protein
MRLHFFALSLIFTAGCAVQKPSATTGTSYSEDLSVLRPEVDSADSSVAETPVRKTEYVEAKYAVNAKLDAVLDSIDRINLSRKYVDGFTILVYSGLDREAALNARKELTTAIPDLQSEIEYAQPNFRVRAGTYFNRLDAQKDYVAVKRLFPNAIITPSRIQIQPDN